MSYEPCSGFKVSPFEHPLYWMVRLLYLFAPQNMSYPPLHNLVTKFTYSSQALRNMPCTWNRYYLLLCVTSIHWYSLGLYCFIQSYWNRCGNKICFRIYFDVEHVDVTPHNVSYNNLPELYYLPHNHDFRGSWYLFHTKLPASELFHLYEHLSSTEYFL